MGHRNCRRAPIARTIPGVPPRPPKPKHPLGIHPNHALLIVAGGVLLATVVISVAVVIARHRRPDTPLTADVARDLITNAGNFHEPMTLPLPTYAMVRRGTPDDFAYNGLARLGIVKLAIVSTRIYRHQREPYDRVQIQLTDQGWAAAVSWGRRDEQTYLIPLAHRQIVDLGLGPGSDPSTGSAEYWVKWKWQPTDLGAQLAPDLRANWHIPDAITGAHATLTRGDTGWQVTSVTIEPQ